MLGSAASDTFWDLKIEALATALANGLRGDIAQIDEQQLIVGVLRDLEPPHVRVLAVLAPGGDHEPVLSPEEIQLHSNLSDSGAVLPVLARHGLAGPPPLSPGSMRWMTTAEAQWQITPLGQRVLDYLRPDGSEVIV